MASIRLSQRLILNPVRCRLCARAPTVLFLPRNRAMTRLGECSFELELHILGYFISDVMKIAMLTIVKFGFMALLFPLKSSNI